MTDSVASESRVVTQDDVDLVVAAMISRDVRWLRPIGWGIEAVGWLAGLLSIVNAVVVYDRIHGADFTDTQGDSLWREVLSFVLPSTFSLLCMGAITVAVGRGARLLAAHIAARRGINLSGLTLGEPIDLHPDDDEDD